MSRTHTIGAAVGTFLLVVAVPAGAATIVFSATGADTAALQATVDSFRAALGNPNNANTPGSQPTGRREINWDGGGAGANATLFPIPMTTFSNRGAVFTTAGTNFEISGQPNPEFGDINATYPTSFTTFSSPRLFSPLGSNVFDVLFTVPGTTTEPAVTRGFGAVFTDVDLADTTTLEFFNRQDASLGLFNVLVQDGGLSFLGVLFDNPEVARIHITAGNSPLGPNDGSGVDVVVMDDFLYAEPQQVPEPATLLLLAAGAVAAATRRR
jgi:hypothetical protein